MHFQKFGILGILICIYRADKLCNFFLFRAHSNIPTSGKNVLVLTFVDPEFSGGRIHPKDAIELLERADTINR